MKFPDPVALKEWAVAIKALEEGKQILLMRKGGIVEETRDFQLQSHSFYLFPTYEHQKKELLKDEYKPALDETIKTWSPDQTEVTITSCARVTEDIEIYEQAQLDKLTNLHIWTDRFAEERLRWKRKNPLHLLLLRVYKLAAPVAIPDLPEYSGCKSWIRIGAELPVRDEDLIPVLTDSEYDNACEQVKIGLV